MPSAYAVGPGARSSRGYAVGICESRQKTLQSNTNYSAVVRLCYLGPPIKSLALPSVLRTRATASEFAAREKRPYRSFLSNPKDSHIITVQSKVDIIKGDIVALVSHRAPACISLWIDDIQNFVLVICNFFEIDDIHTFWCD